MEERHLNFNVFVQERSAQILKFTQTLQCSTNKRTHQALPRSVRRRAMSHNRFRIPLRLRRPLQADLIKSQSMQKLPRCRKSIRKSHRLLLSYKHRALKTRWLSNHLWASRRMRMCTHAGWKIGSTMNNKSFRGAYRSYRHGAVLMDYSYLQQLRVRVGVEGGLPECIRLRDGRGADNRGQYSCMYEGEIYGLGTDGKQVLICPMLMFKQSQCVYRCMFDPYALEQIRKINWSRYNQVKQVQINKCPSEVYLLLGPEAAIRCRQGFNKLGIGLEGELSQVDLGIDSSSIRYINMEESKKQAQVCPKPLISEPIVQRVATGYDPSQNKKIRQDFYQALHSYQSNKDSKEQRAKNAEQFWHFYDLLQEQIDKQGELSQQYVYHITNRSKYTHKRKNKLTKEEKRKVMQEDADKKIKEKNVSSGKQVQKSEMEIEQPKIQQEKINEHMLQLKRLQTRHSNDPVMIANFTHNSSQNTKNSLFRGCLIFCSSRHNCQIWRALSQTNIKVIGRKQFKHCMFESDMQFFPDDYASSVCFEEYNKSRAVELIDKHKKRPPQKRPNYEKLNSPYPFYFFKPADVPKSALVSVKVEMLSRGRCFPGSYICKLELQDYEEITKVLQNSTTVKSILSEPIPIKQENEDKKSANKVDYTTQTYEQVVTNLSYTNENALRKIIGFVTYGAFVLSECKQGGVGYIYEDILKQQLQSICYVLIRKPTSRHYFVAIIRKI